MNERPKHYDQALLIKIVGILSRQIKDKADKMLAYRELIPFLIASGFNLDDGMGVCKGFDNEVVTYKGNNKNKPVNGQGITK